MSDLAVRDRLDRAHEVRVRAVWAGFEWQAGPGRASPVAFGRMAENSGGDGLRERLTK